MGEKQSGASSDSALSVAQFPRPPYFGSINCFRVTWVEVKIVSTPGRSFRLRH